MRLEKTQFWWTSFICENSMTKVLSLFDWMACGLVALKRIGVQPTHYYASEIDWYAKYIAKRNNPELIHIGNVKKVNWTDYEGIDLLIGGSPCQWFSFAGKQLNFEDHRSKLFFEYVRILREAKPKHFLLENVVMKKEWVDIISDQLWVRPIEINSSLVSAQNRRRLYRVWKLNDNWEYNQISFSLPSNRNIKMRNIMQSFVPKEFYLNQEQIEAIKHWKSYQNPLKNILLPQSKSPTLTARWAWEYHSWMILIWDKWKIRTLTPLECERLQTLPDNYTAWVDNSQRYKMLGNGWTVDVIAHIFKSILV